MQVYSLISNLKNHRLILHVTPWSLDLFNRVPFQLRGKHAVLQPFRRIKLIVHIVISVLARRKRVVSRCKRHIDFLME